MCIVFFKLALPTFLNNNNNNNNNMGWLCGAGVVEASNRKGQKVSSQSSLYCQVFKVHSSTGNEIIRVTKATEK